MFVILKNDYIKNNKSIINIMYGDKYDSWINIFLDYELNDLNESNINETISYMIEDNNIVMLEKTIKTGYLYNTESMKKKVIVTIEAIEYDTCGLSCYEIQNNKLFKEINSEINNRVLKSLDKESLYQVFNTLNKNLTIKKKWTSDDFVNILNDILKNFKKELYSSIAKKLNRYRMK